MDLSDIRKEVVGAINKFDEEGTLLYQNYITIPETGRLSVSNADFEYKILDTYLYGTQELYLLLSGKIQNY